MNSPTFPQMRVICSKLVWVWPLYLSWFVNGCFIEHICDIVIISKYLDLHWISKPNLLIEGPVGQAIKHIYQLPRITVDPDMRTEPNGTWSWKLYLHWRTNIILNRRHCILIYFIFYRGAIVKQDHYMAHFFRFVIHRYETTPPSMWKGRCFQRLYLPATEGERLCKPSVKINIFEVLTNIVKKHESYEILEWYLCKRVLFQNCMLGSTTCIF